MSKKNTSVSVSDSYMSAVTATNEARTRLNALVSQQNKAFTAGHALTDEISNARGDVDALQRRETTIRRQFTAGE